MGFRTVVILENDSAHEWSKDPELGSKISAAMNQREDFCYGNVAECVHADTQTLAIFDGYNMSKIASSNWRSEEDVTEMKIKLLRQAAEQLGFKLTKIKK